MNKTIVIAAIIVILVAVAAGAYGVWGKNQSHYGAINTTVAANPNGYTVAFSDNATTGNYLTSSTGFTLYFASGDSPYTNTSSCYGQCAVNWPPFYVQNLKLAPGLNASDFGTMTRSDGTQQLTYKGHPLYLFTGDQRAGVIMGQNVGGFTVATK